MRPPSRAGGRGRVLAGLRRVRHQLECYARSRAGTEGAAQWAAILGDALEAAYGRALEGAGCRASLATYDARRAASRKTRGEVAS